MLFSAKHLFFPNYFILDESFQEMFISEVLLCIFCSKVLFVSNISENKVKVFESLSDCSSIHFKINSTIRQL